MKIDKSLLSGSMAMLVLRLLAEGDLYGYQIIEELERRSDATFALKAGTLYPSLHGLEGQGAVVSYEKQVGGRTRKYYRLTREGRALLEQKAREWEALAQGVAKVMGGGSYEPA